MTTPQAVVFDLGKVLLDFDYGIAIRRIQKSCRLSLDELRTLIDQSPLLLRYESNGLTTAQFFEEVRGASGFWGTLDDFRAMFAGIFTAIEPMVSLQEELRARGIPTYIFSNTNEIAIQHIREKFPFFNHFTGYIFSFEHNAMKPDAKLYDVVEKTTGHRGFDLLYIDDRPENISAGSERKWQTILHEDPIQTRAAMRKSGLPV